MSAESLSDVAQQIEVAAKNDDAETITPLLTQLQAESETFKEAAATYAQT